MYFLYIILFQIKNYEFNFFFKCLTFSACVASGRKRALKDENTLGGIKKDAVDIKQINTFLHNKLAGFFFSSDYFCKY